MRLFFAAFPQAELRRKIHDCARSLELPPGARLVPPENYHMTLVFLGDVAQDRVQAVARVGRAQGRGPIAGPMVLRFDRWDRWNAARVLVASAPHPPQPLLRLRAGLAAGLGRIGAAFDPQPLHPHITVARNIAQAPVLPALSGFEWTLSEFSLVASRPAAAGSVYTVIDTWPLLDIDEPP